MDVTSMHSDIIIIGAGVVGCALARELSFLSDASVTVLEMGADVAEGASKANSGIVHAGFDAKRGSLKARYNVEGSKLYPDLCRELSVPYRHNGAMVLAFSEEDRDTLRGLLEQGVENGVEELRIIERDEVLALEPNTNPDVVCALLAPTSALVSPYELTFALADHAALNGAKFVFDTRVESARREGGRWQLETSSGTYTCDILVNCAGTSSAALHNLMTGREELRIINRRGQYWLLDHAVPVPFEHTMFQCPTKMGKGVLIAPTVHGNVLLGPNAEDIDDPLDTATTAQGLEAVLTAVRRTWPKAETRSAVTNFAGIRAHEAAGEFRIGAVDGAENAYEAVGIESPGLSAAPAIARDLAQMIAADFGLERKTKVPYPAMPKPFNEMTPEEQAAACEEDPLNGTIICRCEVVTEAEIRRAIRRPIGAKSVDAVKRRTRAGMGRCQGGFCAPRVMEILADELGVNVTEITKNGGGSYLLTGTLSDAWKEAEADA